MEQARKGALRSKAVLARGSKNSAPGGINNIKKQNKKGQIMPNKAVTYIDLLGFSNCVQNSPDEAIMMLSHFNTILSTLNFERSVHPSSGYAPALQSLARRTSNESFEHFLPFSDAVFIVGSNCSDFILQLGHFVYSSFMLNAHVFANPDDETDPTASHYIGVDNSRQVVNTPCHEPPVLFRGGVAFGDVIETTPWGLFNNQASKCGNLMGEAVVRAVRIGEMKIKGPRIVFDKSVYDQLNDDAKLFCRPMPEDAFKEYYEILWPAMGFVIENKDTFPQEISHFYDIFNPAYNLWQFYKSSPAVVDHYVNFLELIVSATIKVYDALGYEDFIRQRMVEVMKSSFTEDERVVYLRVLNDKPINP